MFDAAIANELRLIDDSDRSILRQGDCAAAWLGARLAIKHYPGATFCCSCCALPLTIRTAAAPLSPISSRVLLFGPANCGKSVLQQKLLLDCPRPSSAHLRSSPYTEPDPDPDSQMLIADPFHSTQPPHIRAGSIASKIRLPNSSTTSRNPSGVVESSGSVAFLDVLDVPYGELLRHIEMNYSPLLDEVLSSAQAVCWCFDGSDETGQSLQVLRHLVETLENNFPELPPQIFVCTKMDLVRATGTLKDLDEMGRGVAVEGEREAQIVALLRAAGDFAAERGSRLHEVSSFNHSGVGKLRKTLLRRGLVEPPPSIL